MRPTWVMENPTWITPLGLRELRTPPDLCLCILWKVANFLFTLSYINLLVYLDGTLHSWRTPSCNRRGILGAYQISLKGVGSLPLLRVCIRSGPYDHLMELLKHPKVFSFVFEQICCGCKDYIWVMVLHSSKTLLQHPLILLQQLV
jgi:hypothetical protein